MFSKKNGEYSKVKGENLHLKIIGSNVLFLGVKRQCQQIVFFSEGKNTFAGKGEDMIPLPCKVLTNNPY
jgi:hypothetical protein